MYDLISEYWWVLVFSVPGLAIAIKVIVENAGLVDSLPGPLRKELSTFDYSYPEHWVVTATIRDGRRYSRLVISKRFQLQSKFPLPFKLRDIEEVAWEGFGEPPLGPVIQLSEGRPGTA